MERTTVNSESVAGVGYHDATQTLEVEFAKGAVYQYFDVPRSVYDELLAIDAAGGSVGSHIASDVKGHYRYARV